MGWLIDAATVAAALFAAGGLFATALSLRIQARSNDLSSLFYVANQLREGESNLMSSRADPESHNVELVNYINLLETFATAVNARLFGTATRKIAEDRLVNDIAILLASEPSRAKIEAAITSDSTFRELVQFETGHRKRIRSMAKVLQDVDPALNAPQ